MLNHHRSTLFDFSLLPKHHCQQSAPFPSLLKHQTHTFSSHQLGNLLITFSHFLTIFIDETTPSSNCFAFPLLLLKHHYNNFSLFPDAETPLFNTFYSSHSQNTPVRHFLTIFINETIPSSNCFAFSFLLLKHHYQQPFIIFPDAETPLFNTFSFETPLSATLHHFSRC
jgi:hypothetical protein